MSQPTKTPELVIDSYKSALAHCMGDQYANATRVTHNNGWYQVQHVDGSVSKYRRLTLLHIIEVLKNTGRSERAKAGHSISEGLGSAGHREQARQTSPIDKPFGSKVSHADDSLPPVVAHARLSATTPTSKNRPSTDASNDFAAVAILAIAFMATVIFVVASLYGQASRETQRKEEALQAAAKAEREARAEIYQKKKEAEARMRASLARQRNPTAQPPSGYKDPRGNLRKGVMLYRRGSPPQQYGFVLGILGNDVEVVLKSTMELRGANVSVSSALLKRSEIEAEFWVKE